MEFTPVTKNTTLPNIRYSFYPSEESAKLSFKLGEIDQIVDLVDPSGFEGWSNIQITKQVKPQRFVGVYFNHANEELKQKPVRQALAYAIKDKGFGQDRAISAIPTQNWTHNPDVKPYDYDIERAKTLLKDFEGKEGEWILNLTTVPNLLKVAESIATDWKELGITTNIQVANTLPEQFDVLLITQEVPSDPDQYSLWHSTQPTNIISYRNPKIDKLLEDGRKTIDREERKIIYQDFQRFLNEDLPVIFLYHPSTYTITRIETLQIPLLNSQGK